MIFAFVCSECAASYPLTERELMVCPSCAALQKPNEPLRGLLEISVQGSVPRGRYDRTALFPVARKYWPDLPVGDTPLWKVPRLRKHLNLDQLYIKNEGMNPTGSFKDRASILVAARAIELGISEIVLASTGNAGSSMAGIAAAAGLNVTLFLPKSAPRAKLVQSLQYGARTILVDGNYDLAYDLAAEYCAKFGGLSRSTGYNPFTIEGKKSVVLELFEQIGMLPDVIFVPVGDGCILAGVFKGIKDLNELGLCRKIPRVIGVQAVCSSAITMALRSGGGFAKYNAQTVADSISVNVPRVGYLALKYLKQYRGEMVTVSDEELLKAQAILSAQGGLFAEPAAACAFAGLLAVKSTLAHDNTIVVLATGSGLKDPDSALRVLPPLPEPITSLQGLAQPRS